MLFKDRSWMDGSRRKLLNNYLETKLPNNSAVRIDGIKTIPGGSDSPFLSMHINLFKLTFPLRQTPHSHWRLPGKEPNSLFTANNCDLNMSLPILRLPQYWPLNDELHSKAQALKSYYGCCHNCCCEQFWTVGEQFLFISEHTTTAIPKKLGHCVN